MKKRLMALLTAVCMLCLAMSSVAGSMADEVFETTAPTAEPTAAPATPAPTAEPTPVPATAEPAQEPAVVSEDEDTAEPTEEPAATEEPVVTEEPAATEEPVVTEEPAATEEPVVTEEPAATEEPVVTEEPAVEALAADLSTGARYATVGGSVSLQVNVSGGVAPYSVVLKANGAEVNSWVIAEASSFGASYAPTADVEFTLTVVDANGATATDSVSIPVSDQSTREYESEWKKDFYGIELTGDWRIDLVAIAETQLGYRESDTNFVIDDDGKKQGYTRYGDFMGDAYRDWCAMFISFCLNYAEIPAEDFPREITSQEFKDSVGWLGAYEDKEHEYEPEVGDLIFFNHFEENDPQHIGIVYGVTEYRVYTIEGNTDEGVARKSYSRGDVSIVGYCNTAALMERAGVETENIVAIDMAEIAEGGTLGYTTADTVSIRMNATTQSDLVINIAKEGTEVLVVGAYNSFGELWYAIQYDQYAGYVRGDLISLALTIAPEATEEPAVEPTVEPTVEPEATEEPAAIEYETWQAGYADVSMSATVEGAESYTWQRGYADENGELVWEDISGSNSPAYMVGASVDNLKCYYRCVATTAEGEVVTEAVALISEEYIAWLNGGNVDMKMLTRAMGAKSLESMLIEGEEIIYVRTGAIYGRFDTETGHLIDAETGKVVAYLDFTDGMIYPVASDDSDAE